MLFEEAIWVGANLKDSFHEGQQVLNLGSSTLESRTTKQPHMEKYIFGPLAEKGVSVIHCDIRKDDGVDLVGDFTDPVFLERLKESKYDGILCCNLLEHLQDRQALIHCLHKIVPKKGILLITVPKQYPYHLDPIDTMYRPNPKELASNFPDFRIIKTEIVEAKRQVLKKDKLIFHKNYSDQLKGNPKLFIRLFLRSLIPFYKYHNWRITIRDLKNMFRPFKVTCIVLQRKA